MAYKSKFTGKQIDNYLDNINNKQDKLVSGENIKTINGESILGEGDLTIEGGADIIVTNKSDLDESYKDVPEGTKAVVVNKGNDILGVNLFDFLIGTMGDAEEVFTHPEAYTLRISSVDTNVELPISDTVDVSVTLPFKNEIKIDMGSDLASINRILVRDGYSESVWNKGVWMSESYLLYNEIPVSQLITLDDNATTGLVAISPALIVDFAGTKTITEYIKNGDNWEVWSEGESGLNTKLNAGLEQIEQLLPTKTSQLENDSNFITSDGLKTINGESIVGSGDITIGGGEDIRYFTEFTVEDFIEACETTDSIYDTTELFNAMKSNKVICVPYRGYDKGFIVASYKSGENVEYPEMYLQKGDIEYSVSTGEHYELIGNTPTFNSTQLVEMAGGEVVLEVLDNHIYRITDPVDYLVPIHSNVSKGITIQFISGENGTTLEFVATPFWANGEMPTIEPSTYYELSLVEMDGVPNVVLTPFKEVE